MHISRIHNSTVARLAHANRLTWFYSVRCVLQRKRFEIFSFQVMLPWRVFFFSTVCCSKIDDSWQKKCLMWRYLITFCNSREHLSSIEDYLSIFKIAPKVLEIDCDICICIAHFPYIWSNALYISSQRLLTKVLKIEMKTVNQGVIP